MSHPPKRNCIRPTTTYIDLNDDVLRVIFQNLNARDLCSVAELCSAFKRIAQEEFALRFKDLNFTFHVPSDAIGNYNLTMKKLHVRQLAPALRNFGSSLIEISININSALSHQSQQIMEMVIKYCGEPLEELALTDIDFSADIVREMQPLLSRLRILKLVNCTWPSEAVESEMFSFCSELHTLALVFEDNSTVLETPTIFPKLVSLSIRGASSSNESIEQLLAANQQVKEMELTGCYGVTSEIIQSIAERTPQIEKIALAWPEYEPDFIQNVEQLKRLTSLKSLQIDCGEQSFSSALKELAAAHIPLECLKLSYFSSDEEFINELVEFKQLNVLDLYYVEGLVTEDILYIVSNLSELTELTIGEIRRNPMDGNDLVEIVRCAPKLQKLKHSTLDVKSLEVDHGASRSSR